MTSISKLGRLRLSKQPDHTDSKGQSENHSFIHDPKHDYLPCLCQVLCEVLAMCHKTGPEFSLQSSLLQTFSMELTSQVCEPTSHYFKREHLSSAASEWM